jgi:prevent-host-death family protein
MKHIKHIQASEAKAKFAELLDQVERGATLVITRHGRAIAHIQPAPKKNDATERKAMQKLMELRKTAPRATVEEILQWRDEGRRF